MRSVRITFALAATAMLAVPLGAASWSAMGSLEPDTALEAETNGAYNWQDAPGDITNRIYFQVFETNAGVNGNVGAAGTLSTRNENVAVTAVSALLGVWRDCNGDGYIGLAESATLEYPAELLGSEAICPAHFGPTTIEESAAAYAAEGYPSNWNGWVTELIPIGDDTADSADDRGDARVIRDNAAKIWGDFGLPDDSAAAAGGTCAVTPLPRGTMQYTGGAINYADCIGGFMREYNRVFTGRQLLGQPVPGADPDNEMGFVYDGEARRGERAHPLNVTTFGDDGTEHAAVKTTDCDPLFRLGDAWNDTGAEGAYRSLALPAPAPTTLPGHNVVVYTPAPAVTNSDPGTWTIPGQVNQTFEDDDDCDTSNDRGDDFYGQLEGDFQGSAQGNNVGKIEAEWNFNFLDYARGRSPERVLAGDTNFDPESIVESGGNTNGDPAGPSGFAGSRRTVSGALVTGTTWNGDAGLIKRPRTVVFDSETGDARIVGAWREVFYAYVGSNTTSKGFALPGGGATGKYGQAQCGAFTSGVHNGWNCDASKWYVNSGTGEPMPEPTANGGFARVGQLYQLRDLDCYDGSNSLGVPLAPAALGPAPCD